MLEAKDSYAPCSEARFTYPNVFLSVYPPILWIRSLQVFVQLVCLIHDVEVGNLPTSEIHQLMDNLPTNWGLLELSQLILIERHCEIAVLCYKS